MFRGLTFLDVLPPQEACELLQVRRLALADELAGVRAIPVHAGSSQLVIEHRTRHLQTELDWLDEVIDRLGYQDTVVSVYGIGAEGR